MNNSYSGLIQCREKEKQIQRINSTSHINAEVVEKYTYLLD